MGTNLRREKTVKERKIPLDNNITTYNNNIFINGLMCARYLVYPRFDRPRITRAGECKRKLSI